MSAALAPHARLTPLERFLRLFTDVREGEGATALLLALNVFVLLWTYYIIKPVREAWILSGSGAEVKSYAAAGQALLLLVLVPLYARLSSRLPRALLIRAVTLFFAGCLGLFYILARMGVNLGVVFFLWVGIFSLMIVAQFWAFANDLYRLEEGKRLFPIVAFGASAGAVFGSFLTGRLIGILGVETLLLLAGTLLVGSLFLTHAVERRQGRRLARETIRSGGGTKAPAGASPEASGAPLAPGGAFGLVLRSRYMLLIAVSIMFLNWVNTTGEYILGKTVAAAAAEAVARNRAGGLSEGAFIGRFYSDFFAGVNLAGLVIQLFLVSRILKYLGVRASLLILPVIALGGYALLVATPLLSAIRWAKTAENATDYSLQNTVRHVLFLPTSREEKYKAKQAIDSFFQRAGDVLSAGLVYAGTHAFTLSARGFAGVNLGLAAVWIALAFAIGLEYRRRAAGMQGA